MQNARPRVATQVVQPGPTVIYGDPYYYYYRPVPPPIGLSFGYVRVR
jgi:hypothetical protein